MPDTNSKIVFKVLFSESLGEDVEMMMMMMVLILMMKEVNSMHSHCKPSQSQARLHILTNQFETKKSSKWQLGHTTTNISANGSQKAYTVDYI